MYNKNPIFLDYHSTTPVDSRIVRKLIPYLNENFGNPSSIEHSYGIEAQISTEEAKLHISNLINCSHDEIIFTSGSTESINLAIQGFIKAKQGKNSKKKCKIVVSPIEHKAVLETCSYLEKEGLANIKMLKVDLEGNIDLDFLQSLCALKPDLLCVMAANHEIGTINDIGKIGEIARAYEVPFFCDATQGVGKVDINFNEMDITMIAFSSHKIYGPKGVGALVVKKGVNIHPLFYGGSQQYGMRPGTLNVPSIVGFGEACKLLKLEGLQDEIKIKKLRNSLQQFLFNEVDDMKVNGNINNRLSGNLHFTIPEIKNGELINIIRSKVAISTGSACSSGKTQSNVLKSIGLSNQLISSSFRIGIGRFSKENEIKLAAEIICEGVNMLRHKFTKVR